MSTFSLQIFSYGTIGGGIDLLRVWLGPLPHWICFVNLLLFKGTVGIGLPFLLFFLFFFKYLFICKWKRMRQVEDDLIFRLIMIPTFVLGFLLQLTKMIGPGRPVTNYVSLL